MSMSFREIQDAVIRKCCDTSQRADVKLAIQFRHAWLWDMEPWTFRDGVDTVTYTSNSQLATGPTDLHATICLYDTNGNPLRGIADKREFFDLANSGTLPSVGTPSAFTVVNGQIFTDTKGDGTTGVLVYEKSKPMLVNDSDTTDLPDGYDLALVHGGKAEMFKLQIVPDLAQSFDQDFTASANALRQSYLREVKESGQQWGAYLADGWR